MIFKQACTTYEPLAKETLLAMLTSKLNRSKSIVVNTGKIIDLSPVASAVYTQVLEGKIESEEWDYTDTYARPDFRLTEQGEVVDLSKTQVVIGGEVTMSAVKAIKNTSTAKALMVENIYKYINNGTWVYYEEVTPRRLLLTNPNWKVVAFDPASKNVCVTMYTNVNAKKPGEVQLNFTLNPLSF